MTTSVDGLVSGLDTTSLINQLMAAEKAPQDRLVQKVSDTKAKIAAYQSLNTKLASVRDAATALASASGWGIMKAASSAPTVATATTASGALGGSLSFTVDRLATASSIISTGTASSLSSIVASGPLLVSSGGLAVGVSSFGGSAGLALGSHSIKVTQASAGAKKVATGTLSSPTTITAGVNDTIDVEVDGVATTYTLAAGTYNTPSDLAAAVTAASGGDVAATVDDTGHLVLTTTDEGTAATLELTGGSALTDLGLTGAEVGGSASVGVDGAFEVDGTVTTVNDVRAGQSIVLNSGTGGTVTATFSGGLRVGTVKAKQVDTGDGSLSAVINAINGAGVGVSASAIQASPGQYRVQLASSATGTAGAVSTDTTGLAGLGSFTSFGTAQDAQITVGSGPGAFTVSSSSNQVTGVLAGVTLNLAATGSATVTVTSDVDQIASKVSDLVSQVNAVLGEIKTQTGYDSDTQQAGLLIGDFTVRQLQSGLTNSILDAVATSSFGSASAVGISIDKNGVFSFDKAKFTTAYTDDPAGVAALFQRGGTSASTSVSLASSTNRTRAGSYDVVITQAAARGEVTGAVVGGGAITNAETIDIRVGGATGTTISYAASAGATLQSIADGLNALATNQNLAVLASVEGGALVVRTTSYGSNASFEVQSSDVGAGQTGIATAAGSFESHVGTNVAGTIDGVTATGVGRLLSVPTSSTSNAAGLVLNIISTASDVAGAGGTLNLGAFTYTPGVAQRIGILGNDAVDVVSGTLTAAINGRKSEIDDLQKQIEAWDVRLAAREAQLKKQFTDMETALSTMKQQSAWLASQVSTLDANSAANNS
jgi:flagellar hook-associated protein 2